MRHVSDSFDTPSSKFLFVGGEIFSFKVLFLSWSYLLFADRHSIAETVQSHLVASVAALAMPFSPILRSYFIARMLFIAEAEPEFFSIENGTLLAWRRKTNNTAILSNVTLSPTMFAYFYKLRELFQRS